MKSYSQKLMFVINVAFALLAVGLIAMILVKAEATATHGQMMPVKITATSVGP